MSATAIGILGGTFDPVHNGHLRLALEVREALGLSEVRLVPLRHPPHRSEPLASPEQRLAMLEAAIRREPRLRVDRRELLREGSSYTVDTLRSLRSELGDTPLCLILGMDAFQSLPSWHRWEAMFDLTHIVVATRSKRAQSVQGELGSLIDSRSIAEPHMLHQVPAGKIFFQRIPVLDISANRIRTAISQGRSVRYLLPDDVLRLIEDQRLYHAS